ncbi:MAG TPA: DMT family transporter [Phycisphaerales bacterium]|nr:DMT family transporter [Phycisphaerales bacterium]
MPQASILLPLLLAALAGVATAFQPGVNAKLAVFTPSRLHGGLANFLVGAFAMALACALARTPVPQRDRLAEAPWWAFTGGLLGAFFVTTAVYLVPRIGAVNYLVAMVLGQMVGTAVIDHFGLVGLAQHPFTWGRGAGLVLIAAGVACVRWL